MYFLQFEAFEKVTFAPVFSFLFSYWIRWPEAKQRSLIRALGTSV